MGTPSKRFSRLDKNYLINSNFQYAQRDSGTPAIDGTSTYQSVDRWKLHSNGTLPTTILGHRSAIVPSNSKSKYSLGFSAVTVGAEHSYVAVQKVESIFARDFINEVASIRCDVKADNHTQLTLTINNADAEDDYSTSTLVHTETVTITPDGTYREFLFENISMIGNTGNGFEVILEIKTLGSFDDNYANIADVKLNIGAKAQEFSYSGSDLIEELQFCQRYYEKIEDFRYASSCYPGQQGWKVIYFKETKRAIPTFDAYCTAVSNCTSGSMASSNINTSSVTANRAATTGSNHYVSGDISNAYADAEIN